MQVADRAAECITRLVRATEKQGSSSMAQQVLGDEQISGDLLGCLSGQKQQGSQDPALRVTALVQIVAAVSQSFMDCCMLSHLTLCCNSFSNMP